VDLDDLVQDVFVRAFAHRSTFDQSRALGPYLMAIARHLYVDRLRKRRYRTVPLHDLGLEVGESEGDDVAEVVFGSGDAGLRCETHAHFEQRFQTLSEYLRRLPPLLTSVYEARFVRGLSQRDAASMLQMTRRRVRTLEARLLAGAARELRAGEALLGKK